ncbi:hypothetical protein B7P43_G06251 [Cryptotermes secundus]|uniref:Uncharacterized protein n=1 Tax=Cryptotermes secundus TaxID=105785 RepID=A0A2J7PQI6_9NEOP|nr:hypothetical protein B7P43_G06251 [Cryptotermes secundus]
MEQQRARSPKTARCTACRPQASRHICRLWVSTALSVLSHLMQQNYAPSRRKPLRVPWPKC